MHSGKIKFELVKESNTLWLTAWDTWTTRTVEDYIKQLREMVGTFDGAPWAMILDGTRWQACPANVFATLQDNSSWCFQHQLKFGVVLLPEHPLFRWQFTKATDVPKPADYQRAIVADKAEARVILTRAGFLEQEESQALGS
ncbi:hypothetical protein [Alkalimonas mucilaginosa]|uniref:Uncharacterized protein n=1 Tax=Alkalimonas mucilaginosa TaxID=3057676 RepID=A0ABU7JAL1_9GAMM|nr:hypothetical protein [Alkalimonas sp. MEB004]MEE2022737.1 hypothetical protein [Alkalimonas sp. MEB004]